jgi:hypothetical protein
MDGLMAAHTSFQQGQHVYVQLRSGEGFRDQFIEKRSTHIVLKSRGRVRIRDVRAVSIDRKH